MPRINLPEPEPASNPLFDPHAEERALRKGVVLEAWAALSAEADRVLLKLSVGGIGLLAAFIAPKGLAGLWEPLLFALALAAFIGATGYLLRLLRLNRELLEKIYLKKPATEAEELVTKAETRARRLFGVGVLFAFALALMLGIRIGKGAEMTEDRVVGPEGTLQKSFAGASQMLRDPAADEVQVVHSTPIVAQDPTPAPAPAPPASPPPQTDQE